HHALDQDIVRGRESPYGVLALNTLRSSSTSADMASLTGVITARTHRRMYNTSRDLTAAGARHDIHLRGLATNPGEKSGLAAIRSRLVEPDAPRVPEAQRGERMVELLFVPDDEDHQVVGFEMLAGGTGNLVPRDLG